MWATEKPHCSVQHQDVGKEQEKRTVWAENSNARLDAQNKPWRHRDGWQTWGLRRRWRWWVWPVRRSAGERRQGWRWGGDQTKREIVNPLCPSRFTLQHQNPSSHWSAHCSLRRDKCTLELAPHPERCVYWVLVTLQCSSRMGYCVKRWAPPDPEPPKQQRGYEKTLQPVAKRYRRGKSWYALSNGEQK